MKKIIKTAQEFIPAASPIKNIPINAASSSFETLISAYTDYKKTVEIETTKRHTISAWKETSLAQIKKEKDILELYLTKSFEQKSETIKGFFSALDKGMESGNSELISHSLAAIIEVAKQSPISGAKELADAMRNPDVKHIEI